MGDIERIASALLEHDNLTGADVEALLDMMLIKARYTTSSHVSGSSRKCTPILATRSCRKEAEDVF